MEIDGLVVVVRNSAAVDRDEHGREGGMSGGEESNLQKMSCEGDQPLSPQQKAEDDALQLLAPQTLDVKTVDGDGGVTHSKHKSEGEPQVEETAEEKTEIHWGSSSFGDDTPNGTHEGNPIDQESLVVQVERLNEEKQTLEAALARITLEKRVLERDVLELQKWKENSGVKPPSFEESKETESLQKELLELRRGMVSLRMENESLLAQLTMQLDKAQEKRRREVLGSEDDDTCSGWLFGP